MPSTLSISHVPHADAFLACFMSFDLSRGSAPDRFSSGVHDVWAMGMLGATSLQWFLLHLCAPPRPLLRVLQVRPGQPVSVVRFLPSCLAHASRVRPTRHAAPGCCFVMVGGRVVRESCSACVQCPGCAHLGLWYLGISQTWAAVLLYSR